MGDINLFESCGTNNREIDRKLQESNSEKKMTSTARQEKHGEVINFDCLKRYGMTVISSDENSARIRLNKAINKDAIKSILTTSNNVDIFYTEELEEGNDLYRPTDKPIWGLASQDDGSFIISKAV